MYLNDANLAQAVRRKNIFRCFISIFPLTFCTSFTILRPKNLTFSFLICSPHIEFEEKKLFGQKSSQNLWFCGSSMSALFLEAQKRNKWTLPATTLTATSHILYLLFLETAQHNFIYKNNFCDKAVLASYCFVTREVYNWIGKLILHYGQKYFQLSHCRL